MLSNIFWATEFQEKCFWDLLTFRPGKELNSENMLCSRLGVYKSGLKKYNLLWFVVYTGASSVFNFWVHADGQCCQLRFESKLTTLPRSFVRKIYSASTLQLFLFKSSLFFGRVYIQLHGRKFQEPKSLMFGQIFYHNVGSGDAIIKKGEILKPYLPVCYTIYLHGEVWKRNVRYLIYVSGICYFKVHRRYS